jgi:large subunit ribosomal protein L23
MGLFSNKKNKGNKEADVKSSVKVEDNNSKETIDSGKKSMKELYSDSGAKGKEDKKKEKRYGQAYSVLFRPLVTEKVSNLSAENKYVFEVAITANKIEVAKAIEEVYGIKPVKVNVVKMIGKNTRYGRVAGKKKNWKKAIVSLPEGKTIKVYEGV